MKDELLQQWQQDINDYGDNAYLMWEISGENEMTNSKTKHIHADNMALYAQDAITTDKPWELWEFSEIDGQWFELIENPKWMTSLSYHRKQKTIKIGNFDVHEPVRKPLNIDDVYWAVDIMCDRGYYQWKDSETDNQRLKYGIIHLTKENAELHRQALLSFTRTDDVYN